ncbi:hypothetical protein [Streptomyces sp. NPDC051214]|uniref:hypothetical protein n=1 Tax=Streptomyces sp. NPDC051214 TaxID=3155282 RepID=UPI00342AF3B8
MQPEPLTPAQAREQLDTARREATEAAALIDTLAERVREGDSEITGEQMAGQKQLAELAELRVTAAERKLAEAQRVDLDARARAVGDRARTLVADDSTEGIVDAAGDVLEAATRLLALSAARDATIREVANDAVAMNEQLGRSDRNPWPSRDYGFMGQNFPPVGVTAVGQGRAEAVHAGAVLGAILAAALAGQSEAQRRASEILGLRGESTKRVLDSVPGLAAALRYDRAAWDKLPQDVRNEAARQGRQPLRDEG